KTGWQKLASLNTSYSQTRQCASSPFPRLHYRGQCPLCAEQILGNFRRGLLKKLKIPRRLLLRKPAQNTRKGKRRDNFPFVAAHRHGNAKPLFLRFPHI